MIFLVEKQPISGEPTWLENTEKPDILEFWKLPSKPLSTIIVDPQFVYVCMYVYIYTYILYAI